MAALMTLWKTRAITATSLLSIMVIALTILYFNSPLFLLFNQIIAALFALSSLFLHIMHNRSNEKTDTPSFYHHILHWLPLFIMFYIASLFLSSGLLDETQNSLLNILLITLTSFLDGIYYDPIFIVLAITLGLLASCAALFHIQLFLLMIPIILLSAAIIALTIFIQRKL